MTITRLDILIDYICERQVEADQLAELAALAGSDPAVWNRVAGAIRADAIVQSGIDAAEGIARSIEMPDDRSSSSIARRPRSRQLAAWSGWVAAAIVAVASILVQITERPAAGVDETPTAMSSHDALSEYLRRGLEAGQIVRELPLLTLDVRPAPDGIRTEVLYLRRLLERTTVDNVIKLGQDEHGRATVVSSGGAAPFSRQSL